jgi:hypothetical protein
MIKLLWLCDLFLVILPYFTEVKLFCSALRGQTYKLGNFYLLLAIIWHILYVVYESKAAA